ncbi:uncharacterized protein LOC135475622 [Liolophura sinensis]|uniref:uncharacterized protein LOC135475622 n=1 Tax=Liolophura sinensis TaxID=3198878 RepID=UPI00315931F0
MASYLGFHGNESVPHQLPASLTQTHFWDKGILNGVPSMLNKYTDYTSGTDDLEISQFSEFHEDLDTDTTPSSQLPPSFHQWQSVHTPELCAPDPDLGLTPEKRVPFARSNFKTDVKDKTERKVRFDVASSSESELEKSPDACIKGKSDTPDKTSCECLGDSVGPPLHNSKQHKEIPQVYAYSLNSYPALKDTQITDIKTTCSTDGKKKKAKLKDKPLKFSKGDETLIQKQLCDDSPVRREQEESPVVTEYNFPFKDNEEQDSDILLSSAFERPEYNSTLRLGNEMKDLASQRPDVAKAVRETLEKSEALRTGINEKAALRVNTQGDVFQGLAPLEVPISDIISQVERDQRSKVKHSGGKNKRDTKSKVQESVSKYTSDEKNRHLRFICFQDLEEPDLMEFFTLDLQREHVDLSVTGVSFPKDALSLAPHDKAFEMYKHNLAWEEFD